MAPKPPAYIEEMKLLYYAAVDRYQPALKKFMANVPAFLVVVYDPADRSYYILGTDNAFENWDQYTNYVFKELAPALELPDTIFRLPADFQWQKI